MKKTALIFGGSRGIGNATVELFCESGYNTVFTYFKSAEQAETLAEKLNKIGNATAVKCDVRAAEQVERVVEQTVKLYKHIDVSVVCAGVAKQNMLADVSESEFDFLTDTNLKGAFNAAKAVVPVMVSQKSGCLVFISSVLGQDGCSCESVYSMTKGGVNAFSKSLAKELGASGIRVNTICPGLIDTEMNANLTSEEKEELVENSLIKRIGEPADIAKAALFLAENPYVTGAELVVSGGLII